MLARPAPGGADLLPFPPFLLGVIPSNGWRASMLLVVGTTKKRSDDARCSRHIGKVKMQPLRWVGSTSPWLTGGGFTGGGSNGTEDGGADCRSRARVSLREPDARISRGGETRGVELERRGPGCGRAARISGRHEPRHSMAVMATAVGDGNEPRGELAGIDEWAPR